MDGTRTAGGPAPGNSTVTTLGVIEGEILLYLDVHGATPIRQLIRELPWPGAMVAATIGALIRKGLVQARRQGLEVVVESTRPGFILEPAFDTR